MTAESNVFQGRSGATPAEQQREAAREFDALVDALRDAKIDVVIVDDTPEPHTPDSIFPNNWVSFHADGRVVLYPLEAPIRLPMRACHRVRNWTRTVISRSAWTMTSLHSMR